MDNICFLLIVGALIGALARLIVPGYHPIGFLVTMLVGVLGIVGGDYIAEQMDIDGALRWIIVVGVTVVLVVIVSGMTRRRTM